MSLSLKDAFSSKDGGAQFPPVCWLLLPPICKLPHGPWLMPPLTAPLASPFGRDEFRNDPSDGAKQTQTRTVSLPVKRPRKLASYGRQRKICWPRRSCEHFAQSVASHLCPMAHWLADCLLYV